MADRPILFSGPMVRAILDGGKTHTRRVAKPQPSDAYVERHDRGMGVERCRAGIVADHSPYQVGDRCWVRETWRHTHPVMDSPYLYRADLLAPDLSKPWKPAIHMPRAACRLILKVTGVRIERLQDITEADILAEGVTVDRVAKWLNTPWSLIPDLHHAWRLWWDSLNEDRGFGWTANPWVWVVIFSPVRTCRPS